MASSWTASTDGPEDLFPLVHRRIDRALLGLGRVADIEDATRRLLTTLPDEPVMLAVPLLVHAVETGDPEPAVPVSAVHRLWWTAAHVFDDWIDHCETRYPRGLSPGAALMAAVVCGLSLPALIAVEDFPGSVLPEMIREFSFAWLESNDGQVRDLAGRPGGTDRQAILLTYRHKTGAAYGAACAMAATLSGCAPERSSRWREFGQTLGELGQFRNDQEDLAGGRDEDLRNGTATFLLACLLETAADGPRRRILELLPRARDSAEVRATLRRAMLAPGVVGACLGQVAALRSSALEQLDQLGAGGAYGSMLRGFVEEAAVPLPLLAAVERGICPLGRADDQL